MTTEITLERQAAGGDAGAQMALARQLEAASQTMPARGWYARAAQSGNPAALGALATSLLSMPPFEFENGMRFMRAAAEQGDGEALRICAALAAQDTYLADNWNTALGFLRRAVEQGSERARGELALLEEGSGTVDIARWLASPPTRVVSESPRLLAIENFATHATCDWLIARARGRGFRARVYDPVTGGAREENYRSNSAANFDVTQWDLPMVFLRTRIAALAGLPTHSLEHPMVLHYEVGQEFEPHYDFLDPDGPGLKKEIALKGQRVATFLLYLNDDYEGAETEFVKLGVRHRGRKGDALVFWNLDAEGAPDWRTKHAGRAPSSGEKWLLSQWIREDKSSFSGRGLAVHRG
ncbi:MAG TPA: 2OG-Fe(II) oxygenase [Rhizomicrobium sp.]|nr:2OG-Fe(II) oxygenase [Rhizomicrobium sp.]